MRKLEIEFTDIVPLGHRCRMTRRLRDHFGFETAFPFDWWLTPAKSVLRFLEEWDVGKLFDPDELEEVGANGAIQLIRNRRYGIKLQHDFGVVDSAIPPDWRDRIPQAKARTAYLMARFEGLNDPRRRILFCREYTETDGGGEIVYKAIRKAMAKRLPLAKRNFVLVSGTGFAPYGWVPLVIDDPSERPWTGDPTRWDPALASLGWTFRPLDPVEKTDEHAPAVA